MTLGKLRYICKETFHLITHVIVSWIAHSQTINISHTISTAATLYHSYPRMLRIDVSYATAEHYGA